MLRGGNLAQSETLWPVVNAKCRAYIIGNLTHLLEPGQIK